MMGILVGIVLVVAGIFEINSGYMIFRSAANIYQQQLGEQEILIGVIVAIGGLLMISIGYGNYTAGRIRREMVGFRKDLAKMWELDQKASAASAARANAAIEVRPAVKD